MPVYTWVLGLHCVKNIYMYIYTHTYMYLYMCVYEYIYNVYIYIIFFLVGFVFNSLVQNGTGSVGQCWGWVGFCRCVMGLGGRERRSERPLLLGSVLLQD